MAANSSAEFPQTENKVLKEMIKSERRKEGRCLPYDDTFAAVGPNFNKVGKTIDISLGGLALEYVTFDDSILLNTQVDVFMTGHKFHLYKVPCRVIYDIEIQAPPVNSHNVKTFSTKRCGIQFLQLSEQDRAQLEFFIETYTNGSANSQI